ncbi:MAG: anaerobic sulfite reductase subunit AsrA [Olsenella sp.]
MGYVLSADGFDQVIRELGETYRLWAPVLKRGEGRFTDTDVVRYDFVDSADQIELGQRSDYSFKELLTPLSQTLFYYTEDEVTVPKEDARDVIAFVRACDLNALRRLDQMYLHNGARTDWYYDRIRDRVRFALIGCTHEFEDCFCASMGSNVAPEGSYDFSLEVGPEGNLLCDVPAEGLRPAFSRAAMAEKDVVPAHVDANETQVRVPAEVPNEVYSAPMWDDYTARCIECGRCNFVCPTCTCYTMQDVFYTDNGRVGERRRVAASCMVDGYTDVAGGGQYRRTAGERMRFKVLHKVYDFRRRFGYDMCVGCGRCTTVCPEYINFAVAVNRLDQAATEALEARRPGAAAQAGAAARTAAAAQAADTQKPDAAQPQGGEASAHE